MKMTTGLRGLWVITLLEGAVAFVLLLASVGGGPGRMILAGLSGVCWLAIALGGSWMLFPEGRSGLIRERASGWLLQNGRLSAVLTGCAALGLFAAEVFMFTFMALPVYLRGLAGWLGLAAGQSWLMLRVRFRLELDSRAGLFPSFASLERQRRRTLGVLAVLGLVYFAAFIPLNLRGAEDANRFLVNGGDEYVIYPILTTMLTPAADLRTSLYRVFEYDDYHYGYPFYALSALVLLPVRLIFGSGFDLQYQLNLLLLRQMVSVLPVVLSAIVLAYLGTRLRSLPRALVVFGLVLTIPAVVRYNTGFWHPDGLTVLCVVLTLLFLYRDRQRLGRGFYLAAFFCGLATAVRLLGVFFALAVFGYLVAAWLAQRQLGRVLAAGAGFILVMVLTVLLANPFLLDGGARGRMAATLGEKSAEMANGYQEPDPEGVYRTGFAAWLPFFERDYAPAWFIGFLTLSTFAGLAAKRRTFGALLLAWVGMMGGYLIFFVAAKAFQYSLPLFVPFHGAAFLLLMGLEGGRAPQKWNTPRLRLAASVLVYGLCLLQLASNLVHLTGLLG